MNRPAARFDRRPHLAFEIGICVPVERRRGRGQGWSTTLGKLEKMFEVAHARRPRSGKVDLFGAQGRKYDQLLARARDRDIEASRSAVAVERPEILRDAAAGIGAVADR